MDGGGLFDENNFSGAIMENPVKYLEDGRQVYIKQQLDDGWFLIEYVSIDENRNFVFTNFDVVQRVFDAAPTQIFDSQITRLKKIVSGLVAEEQELRKKIAGLESEAKERLGKFSKIVELDHIEQVLDGKITHGVLLEYIPKIVDITEEKSEFNGRLRMLGMLYSTRKKTWEWNLSRYSDGSGEWREIILCKSLEDAKNTLAEYINGLEKVNENHFKAAEQHGIIIRNELVEAYKAKKHNLIADKVNTLKTALLEAEKELNGSAIAS